MDDEMLRARLRAVGSVGDAEPRREFIDALHDELAGRLGLAAAPATTAHGPRRRTRVVAVRRWLMLAATIALLVAALANYAAIGSIVERLFHQPSLLETIETSGTIRIAVRVDDPQSTAAIGGIQGFDVDVARAIASRLGVVDDLVVLPVDEMRGGDPGDWQIAFPSRAVAVADELGVLATGPYYRWPIYAVVAEATPAANLDALVGRTACAVTGGAGARWLAGQGAASGLEVITSPPSMGRLEADSDAGCFDELAAGRASVVITERQLAADLATRGGVSIVGSAPVAREPRPIVIQADVRGSTELRDRLDVVLDAFRRDGTLSDKSRRWFGGEDLTDPAG